MSETDTYGYEIDVHNRIVAVDEAWLAFARDNGAVALTRDKVIGEHLSHFVIGWRACDLYTNLFAVLRSSGARVSLPFRCDAPDTRRYMALEIAPQSGGRLKLAGRLLHSLARRRVPLLDLTLPRNGQWHIICAICRRLRVHADTWREIEDALGDPYSVPAEGLPQLSHDVCADCTEELRKAANAPGRTPGKD